MIAFLYYISYNINMENYQLESKIKNVTYGRGYVYLLQYHIVWVTKYRKPILVSEIEKEVKEYLLKTLKSLDVDPIAMEIMPIIFIYLLTASRSSDFQMRLKS